LLESIRSVFGRRPSGARVPASAITAVPRPAAVYAELSASLAPDLESAGMTRFRRVAYPAWRSHPDDEGCVVFLSLQVDSKATDPYAGGGIRIELERSRQSIPARGLNGRALFYQLMTADELEALLDVQNGVIASLPAPPDAQVSLYPEGAVRQDYLRFFEQQKSFDAIDCWLRYSTAVHVREWTRQLVQVVHPLVERAAVCLDPERLALGKGSLLP
jgi:hypothetical protein